MKCPNCELASMNDTGRRQHNNCIVWFCPRCGIEWTFMPDGVTSRTSIQIWDEKYIDYVHLSETMPKEYLKELLRLYPEYLRPVPKLGERNPYEDTYRNLLF